MVRKCRRIAEIAAVEMAQVSVKTRARGLDLEATAAAAAATATATASSSRMAKRRKVTNEELDISTPHNTRRNRTRTRRRFAITPENSILPSPEVNSGSLAALEDSFSSRSPDQSSASCCSSNGSSERIELADLKVN
uniref:Uncharacterized protein n=1 Tax=Rhizophora mucronata TaxID=61149 RepID=A0A2P2JUB3_RHIMU